MIARSRHSLVVGLITLLGVSLLSFGWFWRTRQREESRPSGDPGGPRKVSETRWVIPRGAKTTYLSDLLRVNREIRLKPIPGQKPDSVEALVIEFVDDRSPLHAAGFRKNDRILRVNDTEVATLNRAINLVHEVEASSRVTVQVERDGKIVDYRFDFE